MSAGHFLASLFEKTEADAKARQDKFDKERSSDVEMYRRVLLDPNASPEQRTKAASEIEKLRNIKGKDGPFSGLANILNKVKEHHGGMKPPPGKSDQASQNPEEIPKLANAGGGGMPSGQPKPQQSAESAPSPKRNVAERILNKTTQGLGAVSGVLGSHPRQLPGLNPEAFAFPSEKELAQKNHVNEVKQLRDDLKEAFPNASDESIQKLVEQRFGGHQSSTGGAFTKKGADTGKNIPEGEKDILGNAIDPNKSYDILENGRGEKQYISTQSKKQIRTLADEHGLPADFVVDLNNPDKLIKVGAKAEQAEYKVFTDPKTQEQYAVPVPRFVGKRGTGGSDTTQRPAMKPPSASNGHPRSMAKPPNSQNLDPGRPKGAISLGKKDTNTARAKAEQATVVISQGNDLIKQIEAARGALGPWKGRISTLEVGAGSADPAIRSLYTSLKSFAALQPALHGSRGIGMQKEFENASGKLADNPDAAIAAIKSLMNTAKHFAEAGGESEADSGKTSPEEMHKFLQGQGIVPK